MIALLGISSFGFIGANVIINTIAHTYAKTLSLIKINQNNNQLNNLLINTDIKRKVVITHKLITSINVENEILFMAVKDLEEPIIQINKLLEESSFIYNNHQEKYFSSYRSLLMPLEALELQIHLFNIRFDDFVKIATIIHYIK